MKICIDAGHYGKYNQSPADKRYYESEFTWKLHLLQKKYLEEYGVEVVTTRPGQAQDRGLYSRGTASEGCALFLSDHTNAVGAGVDDKVDYPAAYCGIDGRSDGIGMALAQCVERVLGTKQPARIEHRRGKNGDYYGVLRGATAVGTPGLILEHSFHTNTSITKWLLDDENVDRLARAEAETIALYYNLAKPLPEKKSGWVEEDGGWRFYLGNTGEPVRNEWYLDGEDWYWFDEAGMMVAENWKTGSDGKWYFLGSDGAMVKNQWVVWKGELYRLTGDGSLFKGEVCLRTDEKGALLPAEENQLTGQGLLGRTEAEEGSREAVGGTAKAKVRKEKGRKPVGEAAGKSEGEAVGKSEGEAAGKSEGKAAGKGEGKAAGKGTGKAVRKSTGKAAGKSTGKAVRKSTGKAAGKSAGETAGRLAGQIVRAVKELQRRTKAGKTEETGF
ncbi:MAG: hypothetical protein HFG59_02755 [Lachnospiraceae bacterium]|nr:hypothetical protein [Lachnospiraceae bacterium]